MLILLLLLLQPSIRKGPQLLRRIPRLSLAVDFTSRYSLRSNYGYKRLYGNVDDHLLCTAEVYWYIFI